MTLDAQIMSVSEELHRDFLWLLQVHRCQRDPFLNLEEATLADGWKLNHGILKPTNNGGETTKF